jgi:hypothetical protein
LWNVRAEWKHRDQAVAWADLLMEEENIASGDIEVVARNGKREHILRSYGKLKLPASVKLSGIK